MPFTAEQLDTLKHRYSTRDEIKAYTIAKLLVKLGFLAVIKTTENVWRDLDGNIVKTVIDKYYSFHIKTNAPEAAVNDVRKLYHSAIANLTSEAVSKALDGAPDNYAYVANGE